jgi:hypothetical protein
LHGTLPTSAIGVPSLPTPAPSLPIPPYSDHRSAAPPHSSLRRPRPIRPPAPLLPTPTVASARAAASSSKHNRLARAEVADGAHHRRATVPGQGRPAVARAGEAGGGRRRRGRQPE